MPEPIYDTRAHSSSGIPVKKVSGFYYKEKSIAGETYVLTFIEDGGSKNKLYFSIGFEIMQKRKKHIAHNESTGRNGLAGLIWARKKILEFEKLIREDWRYQSKEIIMTITWTDNRRRDAYYKGLWKYGYAFEMSRGSKVLLKRLYPPIKMVS